MAEKIILPFDMSLRFWSDSVPFADLGGRLNVPVKLLYTKGLPKTGKPPIAGRIAARHYALLAHEKGTTFAEVTAWLARTVAKLQSDDALVRLLDTRMVGSLFWIAMFGRDPVPTPTLDPGLVSLIARVHSQALIENYSPVAPDLPTKTWFPERAA